MENPFVLEMIPFVDLPDLVQAIDHRLQALGLAGQQTYDLRVIADTITTAPPDLFLLFSQARLLTVLNQWQEAEHAVDLAMQHCEEKLERAVGFYLRAVILEKQGLYRPSLASTEQVIGATNYQKLLQGMALILHGRCQRYLGNAALAEIHFHRALRLNEMSVKATARKELALISAQLGRFEEADTLFEKARVKFHSLGDDYTLMHLHGDEGLLAYHKAMYYHNEKKPDKAREYFKTALKYHKEHTGLAADWHDAEGLARAFGNCAETAYYLGAYEEGLKYSRLSLELSCYSARRNQIVQRFLDQSALLYQLAQQQARQGKDAEEARQSHRQAIAAIIHGQKLAEAIQDFRLQSKCWHNRSLMEEASGHYLAAMSAATQSHKVMTRIPKHEQQGEDYERRQRLLERVFTLQQALFDHAKQGRLVTWEEIEAASDKVSVDNRSYVDYLYEHLLPILEKLGAEEGHIIPDTLARMLALFRGYWFKNAHYAHIGFALTTTTVHLRFLTEKGILERRGTGKGTQYRLHPNLIPLPKINEAD